MDGYVSRGEFRALEPKMRALKRGEFITLTKDFTDKQRFAINNFPNSTAIVTGRKDDKLMVTCVCRHEDRAAAQAEVAKLVP
jgi:hypothetical protein